MQDFLPHLAGERNVSAFTQNQAKPALLFLYREVLKIELPWPSEVVAAKATQRLPVVLTPTEARRLLAATSGTMGLMLALLHSTGIRLLEGLWLRVQVKPIYLRPPHPQRPGTGHPYRQPATLSPVPTAYRLSLASPRAGL